MGFDRRQEIEHIRSELVKAYAQIRELQNQVVALETKGKRPRHAKMERRFRKRKKE